MDDLISRQNAIKDAESWVAVDDYEKHLQKNVVEWLKEFPSAEHGTNLAEVGTDLISRQQAIDAVKSRKTAEQSSAGIMRNAVVDFCVDIIKKLPSAQPEIIRCKDCKYWNKGSCEYREHAVNCQDYMVGDIETEAEHFCGYAERREDG